MQRISISKFAAIVFVLLLGASLVYSWGDAYSWVEVEHVHIPVEKAAQYVIENSTLNETTVVLFTGNFFSVDMVKFYLDTHDSGERELWPYPEKPADAYKPELNETFLIERCEVSNVKYLILYEHGNVTYFDSDWKSYYILDRLVLSGRFTLEAAFGDEPRRVSIIRFIPNS